jgi:hypothetical protein
MLRIKIAALVGALMMLATTGLASAQTAYDTPFATSITFQNVGTGPANVQFSFYNEKAASPTVVNRNDIAAGSGSSLFVGGLSGGEALPPAFKGSAVLSANQPVGDVGADCPAQRHQPGQEPPALQWVQFGLGQCAVGDRVEEPV